EFAAGGAAGVGLVTDGGGGHVDGGGDLRQCLADVGVRALLEHVGGGDLVGFDLDVAELHAGEADLLQQALVRAVACAGVAGAQHETDVPGQGEGGGAHEVEVGEGVGGGAGEAGAGDPGGGGGDGDGGVEAALFAGGAAGPPGGAGEGD